VATVHARTLKGRAQPPTDVFLRAVDLVVDHSMAHLAIKRPAPLVDSEPAPASSGRAAK
jgi:hypothetical protein